MARHFNELRNKMSPERLARVDTKAREMLAEVRREAGQCESDSIGPTTTKSPPPSKLDS